MVKVSLVVFWVNSGLVELTTSINFLVDNHHAVRYHGQSKEDIAEEHLANRQKLNLTIEE